MEKVLLKLLLIFMFAGCNQKITKWEYKEVKTDNTTSSTHMGKWVQVVLNLK